MALFNLCSRPHLVEKGMVVVVERRRIIIYLEKLEYKDREG